MPNQAGPSDSGLHAAYLGYQYDDGEKLRIRRETHARYSEAPDRLSETILHHLALAPGLAVLDVGCGTGTYHADISGVACSLTGVDTSPGMLREARTSSQSPAQPHTLPPHFVQADAQALPFPSAAFDRILAAHMLYHVPDRERALAEMRRVLRPGGRVVLATNGVDYQARLSEVHREAALELGYEPSTGDGQRFTLQDRALVERVFPNVERYVLDNALTFNDPEPLLRYYASGPIDRLARRPPDGSHRAGLLARVQAGVEAIMDREGVFRDPKCTGCFVAYPD